MFREAVTYTAASSGFSAALIEKDYFCTVLLQYLFTTETRLVFKGGTCLAKVHAGFYRLSEDLDFTIEAPEDGPRSHRRGLIEPTKRAFAGIPAVLPEFETAGELSGAFESRQYLGEVRYASILNGQAQFIQVEVGLRERLQDGPEKMAASSVLLDPVSGRAMVEPITLPCISHREAFAEKFRAALTRQPPAVRDFFDLDFALRRLDLAVDDDMIARVQRKLSVQGNDSVDTSAARFHDLRRQVDAQLRPVLRDQDFAEFDVDRAIKSVVDVARRLSP